MPKPNIPSTDRRDAARIEPPGIMHIDAKHQGEPIADAQILNISRHGVALRCSNVFVPGERISFSVNRGVAPVLARVLACEPMEDGWFRLRCRCILGGFDISD